MSHHGYYLALARAVALRSTCMRAQVGAVLVCDDQILSTGFNGAPRHMAHCEENQCALYNGHCIRCVHAETNALLFAHRKMGSILYSSHVPCVSCCQHLINFGVGMVYYDQEYSDDRIGILGYSTQQAYLLAAGVECYQEKL